MVSYICNRVVTYNCFIMNKKLEINTALQISKTVHDVFEAIAIIGQVFNFKFDNNL